MAGCAITILDRVMGEAALLRPPLCSGFLLFLLHGKLHLPLHSILMTRAAKPCFFHLEELLLRGRMSLVAVQTSRLVYERPVDPVLAKDFIHHVAVTTPAKLKSRPPRLEWGRRCRRVVALAASLARHRSMDSVEQYAGCVRAVRVVARNAIRLGNRIIDMLAHESGAVRLVTFNAESRH
jgi:hypothetical protein